MLGRFGMHVRRRLGRLAESWYVGGYVLISRLVAWAAWDARSEAAWEAWADELVGWYVGKLVCFCKPSTLDALKRSADW